MADAAPFLSNERPPLRDDARFQAREMLQAFEQRKAELLKSAASFQAIPNRPVAGDVADVVNLGRKVEKMIDDRRKELTDPFREAERTVNATCTEFWADVDAELNRLEQMVDSFRRAERAMAEAAQKAQEEERARMRAMFSPSPAPESAPVEREPEPVAAPRPIRGAYGAKVTAAKKIEVRVVDVTKVPLEILDSTTVKAAIEKVAKDLAKHRETIPGIEITRGDRTQIRS